MKSYPQFKFLVLKMLFIVFILSACSTWGTSPINEPVYRLEIDENDKTCVSAQDCVLVWTDCSACECGTPLNQQSVAKYEKAYEAMCTNYQGPVCDMSCPAVNLDCINNVCITIQNGE